jgi:hypothetical protein
MDIETTGKVIKAVLIKICRGVLYILGEKVG